MEQTIVGSFQTRRDAEIAVERLVQQHGIERTDVLIYAQGASNTVGLRAAGADAESGHSGVEKDADPALNGPIELAVDCHGTEVGVVEGALKEAGAQYVQIL